MKKNLLALALLSSGVFATAQITVTNAVFPSANDVNEVNRVRNLNITLTAGSSTAQTWDFSNLVADSTYNDTIKPASSDPNSVNFPNAQIIYPFGKWKTFASVTNNNVNVLGTMFYYQGNPLPLPFNNPAEVAYSPMSSGENNTYDGAARFSLPIASVPTLQHLVDSVIASQGLPVTIDSVRIDIISSTNLNVNAFGNVSLPGGNNYDVLRVKRTLNLDTQIYAYAILNGFPLGWQNVTSQLAGNGTNSGLPLGPQVFISYEYQSNVVKTPVLTLDASAASPDVATEGKYKRGTGVAVQHIIANSAQMAINPNPAISTINVSISALVSGEYRAVVTDVSGRQVADLGNFLHTGNATEFNVDAVPTGMYWLTILNSNGQMMATKPLAIAK